MLHKAGGRRRKRRESLEECSDGGSSFHGGMTLPLFGGVNEYD